MQEPNEWILKYKPLAAVYLEDFNKLNPLESELTRVGDAASAQTLLEKVRLARASVQSGSRVTDRLDAIEKLLIAKGAKP